MKMLALSLAAGYSLYCTTAQLQLLPHSKGTLIFRVALFNILELLADHCRKQQHSVTSSRLDQHNILVYFLLKEL